MSLTHYKKIPNNKPKTNKLESVRKISLINLLCYKKPIQLSYFLCHFKSIRNVTH